MELMSPCLKNMSMNWRGGILCLRLENMKMETAHIWQKAYADGREYERKLMEESPNNGQDGGDISDRGAKRLKLNEEAYKMTNPWPEEEPPPPPPFAAYGEWLKYLYSMEKLQTDLSAERRKREAAREQR